MPSQSRCLSKSSPRPNQLSGENAMDCLVTAIRSPDVFSPSISNPSSNSQSPSKKSASREPVGIIRYARSSEKDTCMPSPSFLHPPCRSRHLLGLRAQDIRITSIQDSHSRATVELTASSSELNL
ncbi:hypothetical protein VTL71DRAFT_13096 [Oculimacula yallundae]|uniref:Uncharacterized protein n=1 Tax=Oculimacula yallundae TaxID=86028 RepID=A0ABR4CPF5_9HELO